MGLLSCNAVSTGIILLKNWQCPQKVQLLVYIFSFYFLFLAASRRKKYKSLCHFQAWRTFVFMQQSTSCVSDKISPLSILGTPIDQWQGIEVRGERGDLENKLFTLNWRSGKHPLLAHLHRLGWSCASTEFGPVSFDSLFFHWLFAGVYWKLEFYICRLPDFLSSSDEHALFSYLAFTRLAGPSLMANRFFGGSCWPRAHTGIYEVCYSRDAHQQWGIFM